MSQVSDRELRTFFTYVIQVLEKKILPIAFQCRQRMEYDDAGHTADFVTAEDIVIAKLMPYRETGSEKHLRDARGVLAMQWEDLNLDAIRRGANGAGMLAEFEQLLESVRKQLTD